MSEITPRNIEKNQTGNKGGVSKGNVSFRVNLKRLFPVKVKMLTMAIKRVLGKEKKKEKR